MKCDKNLKPLENGAQCAIQNVSVRSFNSILKYATNAETFEELYMYSKELFDNKCNYSLVQLWFAQEYFLEMKEKLFNER